MGAKEARDMINKIAEEMNAKLVNPVDPDFTQSVDNALSRIRNMLISKNKAYGNSALEPVRIFSKSDEQEGLRVRIDDKLSRIAKGGKDDEDAVSDLIGYLVLLKISESKK